MLRCLVEKSLALFFVIFLFFCVCIFFFFYIRYRTFGGANFFFSLTGTLDLNGHQHLCQYWFHYYYYYFFSHSPVQGHKGLLKVLDNLWYNEVSDN